MEPAAKRCYLEREVCQTDIVVTYLTSGHQDEFFFSYMIVIFLDHSLLAFTYISWHGRESIFLISAPHIQLHDQKITFEVLYQI